MIKKALLMAFIVLFPLGAMAQTSTKVKNLEKQRKVALAEIETTNRLLNETKKTANNLMVRLNLLIEQISSRRKVISLLNQEINELDKELKLKEQNIQSLERELQFKRKNYAQSLAKMQTKRKTQDRLLFILAAESFSQSYRRLRYLREYASYQKEQAKEIVIKQEELNKEKQELERGRQEKLALLQDKQKESNTLQTEEKSKQTEVSDLKKKEKSLQAQLSKKRKQAQELNRQIELAIEEEIRRAEAEARAAAKAKAEKEKKDREAGKPVEPSKTTEPERVAETTGGYAMTKAERALSSNFASNKGKLPYPVKGKYKIVSRFGTQKHQELKYVTIENNGIEIQTTPNSDAYAVFGGVVTSVFVVPGYNSSVIVQHGNYRTIYANLKQVYVKKGDKVSTGQSLGRIFTDTEMGNATILHFELRKDWTKLNPEHWLD